MKRWLIFLLAVPAVLFIVGLLAFSFFVLSFFPAYVTWTAVALMSVVGVWLFFGRRGQVAGIGSETSLMGRQTMKEGLL